MLRLTVDTPIHEQLQINFGVRHSTPAMQNDVTAATRFVEDEVRRLLSGSCEAWEMVMTVRACLVTLPGNCCMSAMHCHASIHVIWMSEFTMQKLPY